MKVEGVLGRGFGRGGEKWLAKGYGPDLICGGQSCVLVTQFGQFG